MIINWHITESSHIGKSACGKYSIEISSNGGHFDYIITENDKITHKSTKPHYSVDDAKGVSTSILTLRNMIF